jgi:ribosomal protein S13
MGFNNNNINASAKMITIPSLNGTLSWADNSVPIGYTGSVHNNGVNLIDAIDGIRTILAQQIFQKAIEGDERFKDLEEDQISTLMKNFAFAYWQDQPKFSKKHVLCNMKTLDCHIYEDMQDALDDMIEGFVYCFDVVY